MKADDQAYLHDILESIELIEEYSDGLTLSRLRKSSQTSDAVVRRFSVIGEAANKLTLACRNKMPEIAWKEIVGMRNKVVHDYNDIDVGMVWRTIKDDLPILKEMIKRFLKKN